MMVEAMPRRRLCGQGPSPVTSICTMQKGNTREKGLYLLVSISNAGDLTAMDWMTSLSGPQERTVWPSGRGGLCAIWTGRNRCHGGHRTADVKFVGHNGFSYAGWSVAPCADINGDGASDPIIGAPEDNTAGAKAGAAFVAFGPEYGTISLQNTYAKWVGAGQITAQARTCVWRHQQRWLK